MSDNSNEFEQENIEIINNLRETFSSSSLGEASTTEIEELLIHEQAEMSVLDVAREFVIDKDNDLFSLLCFKYLNGEF